LLAREGDFIETTDDLIFDVKGLVHPKTHVIAFLRYFPDPEGTRFRNGVPYKKVYTLKERYQIVKEKFPRYLYQDSQVKDTLLQAVPREYIRKIYQPQEYLSGITNLKASQVKSLPPHEKILRDFALVLHKASEVSLTAMGVSGSFLVGLPTPQSDLDFMVYGSQNGHKVYEAMEELFQNPDSPIRRYRLEELKKLWEFRSQDTSGSFEEFLSFEQQKRLQGKFETGVALDFYIRLVKDWDEIKESYEDYRYTPLGTALVEGVILGEEDGVFTPCRYPLAVRQFSPILPFSATPKSAGSIREIISYRGRFCEVRKGETVKVRGIVERVEGIQGDPYLRLIVGNHKLDFLKICDY
jgi:hypothetical protein